MLFSKWLASVFSFFEVCLHWYRACPSVCLRELTTKEPKTAPLEPRFSQDLKVPNPELGGLALDPSAAEFSHRRRKIWPRRKSAEKKFGWPKIRRKNKIRPPPNFLRPIFGGGSKNAITAFSTSQCREQARSEVTEWLISSSYCIAHH